MQPPHEPHRHKFRKGGGRPRGRKHHKNELVPDQPVLEMAATVRCQICGLPVDRKRLHFHMVRFHGAALRPNHPDQP